jgi:hypothetical protein
MKPDGERFFKTKPFSVSKNQNPLLAEIQLWGKTV